MFDRNTYLVFYGFMLSYGLILFGFIFYNNSTSQTKIVDLTYGQELYINVKDSRYHNDYRGARTFYKSDYCFSTSLSVFNESGLETGILANIYPPYLLTKQSETDTIWIYRQQYAETRYMLLPNYNYENAYFSLYKILFKLHFKIDQFK